jgi:septal ring factor EnvC (AmiA/AmiB activator)
MASPEELKEAQDEISRLNKQLSEANLRIATLEGESNNSKDDDDEASHTECEEVVKLERPLATSTSGKKNPN